MEMVRAQGWEEHKLDSVNYLEIAEPASERHNCSQARRQSEGLDNTVPRELVCRLVVVDSMDYNCDLQLLRHDSWP